MAENDADRAYARAHTLLEAGQPEAARVVLAELVSAHPNHIEGWLLLATVVEVAQAVDCLQRVLAIDPQQAQARKWLPLAQREQQRLAALAELIAQPPEVEDEVPLTEPGDDERPVPRLGQYLLDFKFIKTDQLKAALVASAEPRNRAKLGAWVTCCWSRGRFRKSG